MRPGGGKTLAGDQGTAIVGGVSSFPDASSQMPAATRRTATARGGAERNPGCPHPMTSRPNGANGDHTQPVPCALSGHRGLCVALSPGFHPGLSPVAPSGHEHGTHRRSHGASWAPPGEGTRPSIWRLATGNFPSSRPTSGQQTMTSMRQWGALLGGGCARSVFGL